MKDSRIFGVFVPLFLLLYGGLIMCGGKQQKNVVEDLEHKTIREGKTFTVPEENLISSYDVRLILRNLLELPSNVQSLSMFYFPEKLSQSYALQDIYFFFQPENTWLILDYCSRLSCPLLTCHSKKLEGGDATGKRNIIRNIEIYGNCFNDVFDISGKIVFEDSLVFLSDSEFETYYKLAFRDWYLRKVLTDEYLFYTGEAFFTSKRTSKRSSVRRKISIKGASLIKSDANWEGKEHQVTFEHEFSLSEVQRENTKEISIYLVDLRSDFCFTRSFNSDYFFFCERSYSVGKYAVVFLNEAIIISGYIFLTLGKDEKKWYDVFFSLSLLGKRCNVVSGFIELLSGDERILLEYASHHYGDRQCDLLCATKWIWKVGDKETSGVGCLP